MKNIYIIIFLLLGLLVHAEIIKLENDDIIKGKILEDKEDYVIIKTESTTAKVYRKKIKQIYYNDDDYYNELTSSNKESIIAKKEFKKTNPDYKKFKRNLTAGISIIASGTGNMTLGLIFFCWSIKTTGYVNEEQIHFFHGIQEIIYFAAGCSIFGIGLIMDIIAIVNFARAGYFYKKYKKAFNDKFTFDINMNVFSKTANILFGLKF